MIAAILGIILWTSGGSRVADYVPYYWQWIRGNTATVVIGQQEFNVEVADTSSERATGLSNRSYLPRDKGMLFLFDEPASYAFTLAETEIALDIIWIRDGQIVYIKDTARPGEAMIVPAEPASEVLEINPGIARSNKWQVGDLVTITFDRSKNRL